MEMLNRLKCSNTLRWASQARIWLQDKSLVTFTQDMTAVAQAHGASRNLSPSSARIKRSRETRVITLGGRHEIEHACAPTTRSYSLLFSSPSSAHREHKKDASHNIGCRALGTHSHSRLFSCPVLMLRRPHHEILRFSFLCSTSSTPPARSRGVQQGKVNTKDTRVPYTAPITTTPKKKGKGLRGKTMNTNFSYSLTALLFSFAY